MFPTRTCEQVRAGPIQQPWSFAVNIALVLILLAMIPSLTKPAQIVTITIIIFELFHAFSHARHLPGHAQQYVIHALTYVVAATIFWALYVTTHSIPPYWWFAVLLLIIAIDLYLITSGDFFLSIPSGVALLIWMVIGYPHVFPTSVLVCLVILGIIGIALLYNERYNCKRMMEARALPYHLLIELVTYTSFILLILNI
jgi:hypothetical protein